MSVTLGADVLARYERFTLYNSPYPAHGEGRAVDLYPATGAPSPVTGEIIEARTVAAPTRPYAVDHDHLIVVDTGEYLVRILHVDPGVKPGEQVTVGDNLGELVRSGYFAPWVDNHLHVGFRPPGSDPVRASGSLQIELDIEIEALTWDGTGEVVETGDTYALLDSPSHPAPGKRFAGIAAGFGDGGANLAVLDGGLPHYDGGGLLYARVQEAAPGVDSYEGPVTLAGTEVGHSHGRDVTWDEMTVLANGRPITGLSLFCARDAGFGVKLICPDETFEIDDRVTVEIRTNRS